MSFSQHLFSCFFVSLIFFSFASSQTLPKEEVEALRSIAKVLMNFGDWDFTVDPCDESSQGGWRDLNAPKGSENAVTCDCSSVVCHVISIVLKKQGCQGYLPNLTGLPFLQEIDLSRNYLNGSLPSEWAALPLVNISLLGNRITGPIPKEYGSFTNLSSLVLEYNQISGELPPELGNLKNIQRLFVSSNYLTGEIPRTFANLTTLSDLDLSFNKLSGPIPNTYTQRPRAAAPPPLEESTYPPADLAGLCTRFDDIEGLQRGVSAAHNHYYFKHLLTTLKPK